MKISLIASICTLIGFGFGWFSYTDYSETKPITIPDSTAGSIITLQKQIAELQYENEELHYQVCYNELLEATMLREGFMNQPYEKNSVWYIYFGHKIKSGEHYYHTFPDGYKIMIEDLNWSIEQIKKDSPELLWNQVLAMASMSYRYGYGGMRQYGKLNEFETELWNKYR